MPFLIIRTSWEHCLSYVRNVVADYEFSWSSDENIIQKNIKGIFCENYFKRKNQHLVLNQRKPK